MKQGFIFTFIILWLIGHITVISAENREMLIAFNQMDAGFREFVQKPVGGHKLFEYINPNSVGVFKVKDHSFACAELNTPLPDPLPRKK